MRRRGTSNEGKNDPERSLGIFTIKSPAVVETVFSRVPFRWVVRAGVCSYGLAPVIGSIPIAAPPHRINGVYVLGHRVRSDSGSGLVGMFWTYTAFSTPSVTASRAWLAWFSSLRRAGPRSRQSP